MYGTSLYLKVAAANSPKSFFLNASQDQGTLIAAFDSWASLEFDVLKRSFLRENSFGSVSQPVQKFQIS